MKDTNLGLDEPEDETGKIPGVDKPEAYVDQQNDDCDENKDDEGLWDSEASQGINMMCSMNLQWSFSSLTRMGAWTREIRVLTVTIQFILTTFSLLRP